MMLYIRLKKLLYAITVALNLLPQGNFRHIKKQMAAEAAYIRLADMQANKFSSPKHGMNKSSSPKAITNDNSHANFKLPHT